MPWKQRRRSGGGSCAYLSHHRHTYHPEPSTVPCTCRKWQEGFTDHEVSILVQEVAGVELPRGLPVLRVIEHGGQVGQDDGALQRGAGVAQGASEGPVPSPDLVKRTLGTASVPVGWPEALRGPSLQGHRSEGPQPYTLWATGSPHL